MKEFLTGLFVIVLMGILAVAGLLLLPFLLLAGFFLRLILGLFLLLFVVWLVGKLTLSFLEWAKKKPA